MRSLIGYVWKRFLQARRVQRKPRSTRLKVEGLESRRMLSAVPVLINFGALTATSSAPHVLTTSELLATDADNSPTEVTFRLISTPVNGVLRRDATALAVNDVFTQQDINVGRISYVYSAGPTTDSFAFALSDSTQPSATTLVSRNDAGEIGDSDSFVASVSSDGRYVAFDSSAFNLTAEGGNEADNVFLRDQRGASTLLASITPALDTGNGASLEPSLSADGRFVAFQSVARDLVTGDTNNTTDVFVYDRQTRGVSRVSVSSAGVQGNDASYSATISADGRYVAFRSAATNLVPGDTNLVDDIFVHDRQTGETTRVSLDSAGQQSNGPAITPAISGDGRYVVFQSTATNLVAGDTNGVGDVFVRDRQTGVTTRVSLGSAGVQANAVSIDPAISVDGEWIAFGSNATNLVAGDTNLAPDVFVVRRSNGAIERVSVSSANQAGNGASARPALSGDGRWVAFQSDADNLVNGDLNGTTDVFVRDRLAGRTQLVSAADGATLANGPSSDPAISADGRYVAFNSFADNLVAADDNFSFDIFARDLGVTYATIGVTITTSVPLNPGVRAPVVDLNGAASGFGYSTTFVEDAPRVTIASSDATVSDADSAVLASVTVRLLVVPDGPLEQLAANTTGTSIVASYAPATGTLTLTGPASVAEFQAVLRRTTYVNLSNNPTVTPTRVVQVSAFDGANTSAARQTTIRIVATNDAPTVTPTTGVTTYTPGVTGVTIDTGVNVGDSDTFYWYANNQPGYAFGLARLTVQISGGFNPTQDRLLYTPIQGIAGSFNASTGLLTLSGIASLERYQIALRSVRYVNSSSAPSPLSRTITYLGYDGTAWSSPATKVIQFPAPPGASALFAPSAFDAFFAGIAGGSTSIGSSSPTNRVLPSDIRWM